MTWIGLYWQNLIVNVVDINVITDHHKVTEPLMEFVNLLTQIGLFHIRTYCYTTYRLFSYTAILVFNTVLISNCFNMNKDKTREYE